MTSDSNEVLDDNVNEADLIDNKGEVKQGKLMEPDSSEEGSEGKKTEEEKKESRPGDEPGKGVSTNYRLRGVVVHSGQASGGHYYSFIYLRSVKTVCDGEYTWGDCALCKPTGFLLIAVLLSQTTRLQCLQVVQV